MWGERQPPQWSHVGFTLMYLKGGGLSEQGIEFAPTLPLQKPPWAKDLAGWQGMNATARSLTAFIQMADLPL